MTIYILADWSDCEGEIGICGVFSTESLALTELQNQLNHEEERFRIWAKEKLTVTAFEMDVPDVQPRRIK
jgi:hypothetical protein